VATGSGYGWRPPSSGVGPFQTGDEVELLATSAWIWVAGVRIERYARGATLDQIGHDGLAITDGDAALRRWVTLVPDEDDAVPWVVAQLKTPAEVESTDASTGDQPLSGISDAPSMSEPELRTAAVKAPDASSPGASPPADQSTAGEDAPTRPVRRAGPSWDDPRSVTDDSRR